MSLHFNRALRAELAEAAALRRTIGEEQSGLLTQNTDVVNTWNKILENAGISSLHLEAKDNGSGVNLVFTDPEAVGAPTEYISKDGKVTLYSTTATREAGVISYKDYTAKEQVSGDFNYSDKVVDEIFDYVDNHPVYTGIGKGLRTLSRDGNDLKAFRYAVQDAVLAEDEANENHAVADVPTTNASKPVV